MRIDSSHFRYQPSLRRWIVLFVVAILFAAQRNLSAAEAGRTPALSHSSGSRPIRLFLLAGQSNAQGYNHIRQYHQGREPFPETLKQQPRVMFWPGSETPSPATNLWTSLQVMASGSFGPEIQFGADMAKAFPEERIAVVKYAVGGTGIARSVDYTDYIPAVAGYDDKGHNWSPPAPDRSAGILYQTLLENVRQAVGALDREGKRWEWAGVIWMQGEHEGGISRKMAGDYATLLSGFIASLRKDLGKDALPVVIGQVNSHTWAFGDLAREKQREVCRVVPRTRLVETVDLPRVSGDAAHFTADGMLTLGSRFAVGMQELWAPTTSSR